MVAGRRALDADGLRGVAERHLSALLGQPVHLGTLDVDVQLKRRITRGLDRLFKP